MLRLSRTRLNALAAERILLLDGAMGTMIQGYGLGEADFRGRALADHPLDLKGDNDILSLTRPEVIAEIHRRYLQAGADIITTNTFNGTAVSQGDYGAAHLVADINLAAARLAREAADEFTRRDPDRPRFVAGSLGPTNRTCSISPDAADPGRRNVTFKELAAAYAQQAAALLDGGADILLIETVFDPLNAKAAVFAVLDLLERRGLRDHPLWISGTIVDASGRTLTGQTPEAFWISLAHAEPAVFGLNCALGAQALRPHVEEIAAIAPTLVSAHPNAGLPNALGGYDQTPQDMAAALAEFCAAGLVNVVGGCCGTTPEHIRAIGEAIAGAAPRRLPERRSGTFLAGLEPLRIDRGSLFVNVGERTNVAGSRRFAERIRAGDLEGALEIGRGQVRGGAQMIDVNMDDPMLDAESAMASFLNVLAADPEVGRVPVMIDSSRWEVLEAGLQRIQGKGVVNSLSLKDGPEEFRRRAALVRRYGAAAVVMAFDERGQADTLRRRLEVCRRAWRILVQEEGFPPQDVIFDPNVFAVATGIPEHDRYALDFIEACRAVKREMPGALVSGGISNLSFSFRGNEPVRQALHAAFLFHAIAAGLDMGIVNAGQLAVYEQIEPDLLEAALDVVLDRKPAAADGPSPTERLLALAARAQQAPAAAAPDAWRSLPVAQRLAHALLTGDASFVQADALQAMQESGDALSVIEGPLMDGMNRVGELFGAGKMFLPQVIRSARVMKLAVDVLNPHLDRRQAAAAPAGKILLATVKGDVHDIGKNIVGVVLGCNNYQVLDLGVMVPARRIVETAMREGVDFVGLSGLITPSLAEMTHVAQEMERAGLTVPLLIGGATTSTLHTAVKIAPHYRPGVVHVRDASLAAAVVGRLGNPASRAAELDRVRRDYDRLAGEHEARAKERDLLPLSVARARALQTDWAQERPPAPARPGIQIWRDWDLAGLRPFIDWTPFFQAWELKGRFPQILQDPQAGAEAARLYADAQAALDDLQRRRAVTARAVVGLLPAAADGDDLVFFAGPERGDIRLRVPFLRQQTAKRGGGPNLCLTDFVAPSHGGPPDWVGAFVVTAGLGVAEQAEDLARQGRHYQSILLKALADRLAEALAESLHRDVRRAHWGYAAAEDLGPEDLIAEKYRGIRPAPGYPACPDHCSKRALFALLDAERAIGVTLTESCAMDPAATVAGWYFAHPQARYFGIGRIGADQVEDYARRAGMTTAEAARWLGAVIA